MHNMLPDQICLTMTSPSFARLHRVQEPWDWVGTLSLRGLCQDRSRVLLHRGPLGRL